VIAVAVAPGQEVAAGEALVTVEAMKMEHTLRAAAASRVAAVLVAVGDRVGLDADLVVWEASNA
jgi:3-methylcrotonyl-CoA carboxylase alpha subunit